MLVLQPGDSKRKISETKSFVDARQSNFLKEKKHILSITNLAVSESFAQSLMALSPVRTISMSADESMPFGGRRYWH